jgi:hypothetical protein
MWFAALLSLSTGQGQAYVEAPYSLGRVLSESTHAVLVEVTRVNKEKGLVIYKKVQDIKGKHPTAEIKHNIGKRGFHPREAQNIMDWAEPGKRAIVFHNGGASETCIGGYWYQCYSEGEWWGMTHAEPYMLRTFVGDCDKLSAAVAQMLAGKEVQVTCFADVKREDLHLKKGKLQTVWASLKRIEWNPRRDFVAWGGEGGEQEFKTVNLLPESGADWRFLPEMMLNEKSFNWTQPTFDDSKWRVGRAPIGYGEDEIAKRKGTTVAEKGRNFVFRKAFHVSAELLTQKGVIFRLSVASDDSATVWINGQAADRDPVDDHEFMYWNREVDLNPALFRSGPNVVAVLVKNRAGSSDLYLDMDISAVVPLPPTKIKR